MWIKICGVTTPEDVEAAIAAGADALGLNLIASSRRRVGLGEARALVEAAAGRAEPIAVVADLGVPEARKVLASTGVSRLQLHGDEPREVCAALGSAAIQAIRVGGPADVVRALGWPGEVLLVDALVPGSLGGTGSRVAPALVRDLARRRSIVLAGGLTPENVADAIREVEPWGVDVASGVEVAGEPRRKDPRRMRELVRRARAAAP